MKMHMKKIKIHTKQQCTTYYNYTQLQTCSYRQGYVPDFMVVTLTKELDIPAPLTAVTMMSQPTPDSNSFIVQLVVFESLVTKICWSPLALFLWLFFSHITSKLFTTESLETLQEREMLLDVTELTLTFGLSETIGGS